MSRQALVEIETPERLRQFKLPAALNERLQGCTEHFQWDYVHLAGLAATGRATIDALDMNRTLILVIRAEEALLGRHPG